VEKRKHYEGHEEKQIKIANTVEAPDPFIQNLRDHILDSGRVASSQILNIVVTRHDRLSSLDGARTDKP
jgi:hypothetical protein